MAVDPRIVTTPGTPAGIAQTVADIERQMSDLQAKSGNLAPGGTPGDRIVASSITATQIAAGTIVAGNIAAGTITASLIAAGTITGDRIAANTITGTNIAAGTITATNLTATAIDGMTITGATIRTAASGARVVMSNAGIDTYNASAQNLVHIDSTTGLITATGIITAQPGSSVPWQTTGFYVGGGNLWFNASAEDPTTVTQTLYITTGNGASAGNFTLRYNSGTVSASIAYNANAATVQTALNAAGVLPAGVTAACTGGPLPGTPITITFSGFSTPTPSIMSIPTNAVTGGTVVVCQLPITYYSTNVPQYGYTVSGGALDVVADARSYHGGNVFRITAQAAGSPSFAQRTAAMGILPDQSTTLSAYFKAAVTARNVSLQVDFQDVNGNLIYSVTTTSSWQTATDHWQRLVEVVRNPALAQRQQVAITGGPTGGTFTLTFNGQTTAAINYNASAAAVLSAVNALSNVSGHAATATGGPLPGTPVQISFDQTITAPTTMTFANSLTGGTSPTPVVSNQRATYILGTIKPANSAVAGEIAYVDGIQLEVGDTAAAFAPRGDEIIASSITANLINVSQLSAITANMGTITAGTITGSTIQTSGGGIIQTSATATTNGLTVTSNGLSIYNTSVNVATLNSSGLLLTGGTSQPNRIEWHNNSVSGALLGDIHSYSNTSNQSEIVCVAWPITGGVAANSFQVIRDVSVDANNYFQVAINNAAGTANAILQFTYGSPLGNSAALLESPQSRIGNPGQARFYIGTWDSGNTLAFIGTGGGNNYALLQTTNQSDTYVNAASQGHLRISNSDTLVWDGNAVWSKGYAQSTFSGTIGCGDWFRSNNGNGWYDAYNGIGINRWNSTNNTWVAAYTASGFIHGDAANGYSYMGLNGLAAAVGGTNWSPAATIYMSCTHGGLSGYPGNNYSFTASSENVYRFGVAGNYTAYINSLGNLIAASSRDRKRFAKDLEPNSVLNRIGRLQLQEWEAKNDFGARHVGPYAEDFFQQFRLGEYRPHRQGEHPNWEPFIGVSDVAGIGLIGVQALLAKVKKLELHIHDLEHRMFMQEVTP